jgi:menaquinone-dependent protoporphyrinogen oxidase
MPAQSASRRRFLKVAAATLGVSVVACSGLGYVAGRAPEAAETATPAFVYGKDEAMNRRILVTYATRTGSTVGVAATIGETLGKHGFAVDVKPVKENPTPEGYQAVLIGSAVNGAKWLPEAVEFVRNHQHALNGVPLALFSVHIMNLGDEGKSRQNRLAYLDAVRPLLKPLDEAFFAGKGLDPKQQSWLEGWLYRTFKIGPEGDCRDWAKIRGWADGLSPALESTSRHT